MNTTTMFCDTHSALPPSAESSSDEGFPELSELVLRQIASLRSPTELSQIVPEGVVHEIDNKVDEIKKAVDQLPDIFEPVKDLAKSIPDIKEAAQDVEKVVEDLVKNIPEKVADLVPGLKDAAKELEKVSDLVPGVKDAVKDYIPDIVSCCFRRRLTPPTQTSK